MTSHQFNSNPGSRDGSVIYAAVLGVVKNRLKRDIGGSERAHSICSIQNGDVFEPSYDEQLTTPSFHRLMNRAQDRPGVSIADAVEQCSETILVLTNRFAPEMAGAPVARQWEVLHRAAAAIESCGMPWRLMNRAPDGVGAADWNSANGRAGDVLQLLQGDERGGQWDVGEKLLNAPESQIRGVFRGHMLRLMGKPTGDDWPGNLSIHDAFEWLKENTPVMWTLAMLAFDPEDPSNVFLR